MECTHTHREQEERQHKMNYAHCAKHFDSTRSAKDTATVLQIQLQCYRYDYTATDTATLHIHTYRYIYTATDTNKLTADTTKLLQIQLQPLHTAIDTHTPTKHSYRYIYSYIHTRTYTILGHSRNAAERRPLSGLPYHFIRP